MTYKPKQPKHEITPEEEKQLLRDLEMLIDAALERGETKIIIEFRDGDAA
jgi:hypothetical protein